MRRRRQLLLVWLACGAVVAVAAVASIMVGYHSSSSSGQREPDGTSGSARAPSASPLASAAASLAAGSGVAAVPRPPDDQLGPVILVPGYGGDASMLDQLAGLLRRAGRTTTTLALPDDAQGDLRGQEQVLANAVSKALAAGPKSVDLVGYSAGGIVVGLFVAQHPSQVRRVVTLGSPLHGTRLAGLAAGLVPSACPTACQQMVPGSALLATLDASPPSVTGVPWLSMWTSLDDVVTPPDSARFAGAVNVELQSVCADDRATHLTLPTDLLADGITLQTLGNSALPLPTPSAADCSALQALSRQQ
jgi:triacylglycerol lipase